MEKRFEAPIVEIVKFDMSEDIMTNNSHADTETND